MLYFNKLRNKNGKIYSRILISFTLLIFCTILLLSTVLYTVFEDIVLSQTYSLISNNLGRVEQELEFMNTTAKNMCLQVYHDIDVSKLMYYSSPSDMEINSALQQMKYYRNIASYIESIYVYNANTGLFFISSGKADNLLQGEAVFSDKGALDVIKNYQPLEAIPRESHIEYGGREYDLYMYTYLYSGLLRKGESPQNAVVVNLSDEWVNRITQGAEGESSIFLMDKDGKILSKTNLYPTLSVIEDKELIKKIKTTQLSPKRYFLYRINGVRCFVSCISAGFNEWAIVQVTPYNTVTNRIQELRNNTILVAFFILLAGLLISFVISNKLYRPIDKILSRLRALESEQKDVMYILRQEFLKGMLTDSKEQEVGVILSKAKEFNLSLDLNGPVCILLFSIDKYKIFCDSYNVKDRGVFKFGIMNVASEVCMKYCSCEAVDLKDDRIVLILGIPEALKSGFRDVAVEFIGLIRSYISNYFNISLSAVVGAFGDTAKDMPQLYNRCVEALFYRTFYGNGSVIFEEDISFSAPSDYNYPIHLEKSIIDSLMSGKIEKVKEIYLEMINDLTPCPRMTFYLALFRLAYSVVMALETIQKNSMSKVSLSGRMLSAFSADTETLDELNALIFSVLDDAEELFHEKKGGSHNYISDTIREKIINDYMNADLSVEYFARMFDMTPAYISKIFKKAAVKTILEFISDVRMEKAGQLLINSNLSMDDIALKVGYSSKIYFYKTFKKYNGVTPGEYRKKNRMD